MSVEHLLLGLLGGKDAVATLLKDTGFNEKDLKAAILGAARRAARSRQQSAEDQYQSLNRYARQPQRAGAHAARWTP